MAYHLEHAQLRVVQALVREHKTPLNTARIILLEHILTDTEEFIGHLASSGAEIFAILAKEYSVDESVFCRLKDKHRVLRFTYKQLEETDVLDTLLLEAIQASKEDKKPILIIEVGGYFARPLAAIDPADAQYFAGVVEDTTFGHNRYVLSAEKIPISIFSVARSSLKQIEARFVGRDAVSAVDQVLRKKGVSIAGRNALVIGYGMIGSNVARALRGHDLTVHVYDKQDHRNLHACIDGFHIHKKRELLKIADIIFAATAARALTWGDMVECKNNVILASVGSKNTEFDIEKLEEQAIHKDSIGDDLTKYGFLYSKSIIVVKNGTAVNFLHSGLPTEILDLVYSEILLCALQLLTRDTAPGEVFVAPESFLNSIALQWLRHVNL